MPLVITSHPGRELRDEFRFNAVPGVADLDRNGSPEAAVYELLRLNDAVWRHGFMTFIRHCHEAGPAENDGRVAGAKLAGYLTVASDARVLRKTRAIMEAAHRGRALSLAELARVGDEPVEDRRKREIALRERALWPMDELGVWHVVEVPRTFRPAVPTSASSSTTELAPRGVLRYEIGAGSTLRVFDALHYQPWLLRQLDYLDAILGHRKRSTPTRATRPVSTGTYTKEGFPGLVVTSVPKVPI